VNNRIANLIQASWQGPDGRHLVTLDMAERVLADAEAERDRAIAEARAGVSLIVKSNRERDRLRAVMDVALELVDARCEGQSVREGEAWIALQYALEASGLIPVDSDRPPVPGVELVPPEPSPDEDRSGGADPDDRWGDYDRLQMAADIGVADRIEIITAGFLARIGQLEQERDRLRVVVGAVRQMMAHVDARDRDKFLNAAMDVRQTVRALDHPDPHDDMPIALDTACDNCGGTLLKCIENPPCCPVCHHTDGTVIVHYPTEPRDE
jgi:hypothetical protein